MFTLVTDPVGAGFVDSLAKPGGNTTGFMLSEYSLNAKLLELLKQIAPNVKRAAVLLNPAGIAQFGTIQTVASSIGVEVSPINVRDASEIERAITAFASNWSSILRPRRRWGSRCPKLCWRAPLR